MRIQQDESVLGMEKGNDFRERLPKGIPLPIHPFQSGSQHGLEFGIRKALQKPVQVVRDRRTQGNGSHRQPIAFRFLSKLDRFQSRVSRQVPGAANFLEIVVLGGHPEQGNRFHAPASIGLGQFDGGKGLVNGVGGTGKQSNLLAGNHCPAVVSGQAVQVLHGFGGSAPAPILAPQGLHQGRAMGQVRPRAARPGPSGECTGGKAGKEGLNLLGVVKVIHQQGRRFRNPFETQTHRLGHRVSRAAQAIFVGGADCSRGRLPHAAPASPSDDSEKPLRQRP